MLCLLIFSVPN